MNGYVRNLKRLPLFRGEMSSIARQRGANAEYSAPLPASRDFPRKRGQTYFLIRNCCCRTNFFRVANAREACWNCQRQFFVRAFVHKKFTRSKTVRNYPVFLDICGKQEYNSIEIQRTGDEENADQDSR